MTTLLRLCISTVAGTVAAMAALLIAVVGYGILAADWPGWTYLAPGLGAVALITISVGAIFFVPIFLFLKARRQTRWWSVAIAGAIVLFLTDLFYKWPKYGPEYKGIFESVERDGEFVDTLVDGEMTLAGWVQLFEASSFALVFGAIFGIMFWIAWSQSRRESNPSQPD